MTGVLVDTSVWVGHFKAADKHLIALLKEDRVMAHPMIIGEIACGTPPDRQDVLIWLLRLRQSRHASLDEVLAFLEENKVYGAGCGWVDVNLLVSVLISPNVRLWTLDKTLHRLAGRFGLAYDAAA